jgi:hypothetical protein
MAKVEERLAVNKQLSQEISYGEVNLKKLNEVEGKEQYHDEVSNRFAACLTNSLRSVSFTVLQHIHTCITYTNAICLIISVMRSHKEK